MRIGLVAKALLLSTLGIAFGSAALAGIPSPVYSFFPKHISVMGLAGGVPDPYFGSFTVHLADNTGNGGACAGQTVVLSFFSATDVKLCSDQFDPSVTVECASGLVCGTTNQNGDVKFLIVGGSTGRVPGPSSIGAKVQVWGNPTNACLLDQSSVLLGFLSAAVFDLDGQVGVGAADLSLYLSDFASGQPWARSDFDGDGSIGAGDLSIWLGVFAASGSVQSCTTDYCP